MELVKGETLQIAMPAMSVSEKREAFAFRGSKLAQRWLQVVLQCATALECAHTNSRDLSVQWQAVMEVPDSLPIDSP